MKNIKQKKEIDIAALGDYINSLIEGMSADELEGEKGDLLLEVIGPIDEYRQMYDI